MHLVAYHALVGEPIRRRWLCKAVREGAGYVVQAPAFAMLLDPELRRTIEEGFPDGDDSFDAAVGLFWNCSKSLLNRRESGEPNEESVRKVEGWIFGQVMTSR
jgi:hypothetical protein